MLIGRSDGRIQHFFPDRRAIEKLMRKPFASCAFNDVTSNKTPEKIYEGFYYRSFTKAYVRSSSNVSSIFAHTQGT